MKIGIFDSGVGGLIIAKAIQKALPEYDYVYLGDTKRVPYGNRSHQTVFEFTRQGVDYLFKKENCGLIIVACNTASARALRRLQREYLPAQKYFFHRSILGVLIPAAEEAAKFKRVGVLGTEGTINSGTFPKEIKKKNLLLFNGSHSNSFSYTKVFQNPAPMLVPLAEEGEKELAKQFIKKYLKSFSNKKLDALILGCTHYPFYKSEIRKMVGKKVEIISQDEVVPKKLKDYLKRHPEITKKLSQRRSTRILVTDLTPHIQKLTKEWFDAKIKPRKISL